MWQKAWHFAKALWFVWMLAALVLGVFLGVKRSEGTINLERSEANRLRDRVAELEKEKHSASLKKLRDMEDQFVKDLAEGAKFLHPPMGRGTPEDIAGRSDMHDLQGTWLVERSEKEGKPENGDDLKGVKLIFSGNSIKTESNGKAVAAKAFFAIDAMKKPKTIDMAAIMPDRFDGVTITLGIYELEGDSLRIAGGKQRPSNFKTSAETADTEAITLKRDSAR